MKVSECHTQTKDLVAFRNVGGAEGFVLKIFISQLNLNIDLSSYIYLNAKLFKWFVVINFLKMLIMKTIINKQ